MADISKEELQHLAKLARLDLNPEEEEGFLKDFESILNYFEHIQQLPPKTDSRLVGRKVVLREDIDIMPDHFSDQDAVIAEFPEQKDKMNKIPPVFE